MGVRVELRARNFKGMEVTSAQVQQAFTKVVESIARKWQDRYLPKHFTNEAYGRYGFAPRAPVYVARKIKRYGVDRPLVWQGGLEIAAKSARPTADYHGTDRIYVTIKIRLPHPLKPQNVAELQKYLPEEIKELTNEAKGEAIRALKALGLKTYGGTNSKDYR